MLKLITIFIRSQIAPKKEETKPKSEPAVGAPSVDFLNSSVPVEPPKSTIGIRKVQPKRGVSVYGH